MDRREIEGELGSAGIRELQKLKAAQSWRKTTRVQASWTGLESNELVWKESYIWQISARKEAEIYEEVATEIKQNVAGFQI